MWVSDAADASGDYAPLINGSDRDFSDPQVLTEPGWPTRRHRPQLISYRLQKFADGTVYDDQMWDNTVGVLPKRLPGAAGRGCGNAGSPARRA